MADRPAHLLACKTVYIVYIVPKCQCCLYCKTVAVVIAPQLSPPATYWSFNVLLDIRYIFSSQSVLVFVPFILITVSYSFLQMQYTLDFAHSVISLSWMNQNVFSLHTWLDWQIHKLTRVHHSQHNFLLKRVFGVSAPECDAWLKFPHLSRLSCLTALQKPNCPALLSVVHIWLQ